VTRCHQLDSQLGPPGLPESAKKKTFISRIQVHPLGTRTKRNTAAYAPTYSCGERD